MLNSGGMFRALDTGTGNTQVSLQTGYHGTYANTTISGSGVKQTTHAGKTMH